MLGSAMWLIVAAISVACWAYIGRWVAYRLAKKLPGKEKWLLLPWAAWSLLAMFCLPEIYGARVGTWPWLVIFGVYALLIVTFVNAFAKRFRFDHD